MSLRDIVSGAGLHGWAQVALVVFFAAFLGIVVYLVLRRRGAWDHVRRLPLDDGKPVGRNSEESDR